MCYCMRKLYIYTSIFYGRFFHDCLFLFPSTALGYQDRPTYNLQYGTVCISVISRYSLNEKNYRGENVYLRNAKIVHLSPLNNS
jgi:hypothetical protein